METQAITTIVTSSELDVIVLGWLNAKFHRSKSERTRQSYQNTINQFRAALQHEGLDLDKKSDQELIAISLIAQAFASFSARGKEVSTSTYNLRLSIISSFYEYAIKRRLLSVNPITGMERAKVEAYASAQPLHASAATEALGKIDRNTLVGKRDYALLAILLQTGRRLNEVVSLQLKNLVSQDGKVTLEFEHCKGGKIMYDTLPLSVSYALIHWIKAYYGESMALGNKADMRPVWVVLIANEKIYGHPLGAQSVADICKKHLGTSKVHTTRHTWAKSMEDVGAPVSDIQRRLGHESLATTGRYLQSLKRADNPYADKLAAHLGI